MNKICTTLAIAFMFPCCCLGQQKEIEIVDGVTIVSHSSGYDDLPESVKSKISLQKYQSMQEASLRMRIANYKAGQKLLTETSAVSNSIRNISQAINLFDTLVGNKEIARSIELTEDQLDVFLELKGEYIARATKLTGKQLRQLDLAYTQKISSILMPFQLEIIGKWNGSEIGLPKLLTETQIGDAIGLSEMQKEKIRKHAQRISDEIREFETRKRKEIEAMMSKALNKKQSEIVEKFGTVAKIESFEESPLEKIRDQLDYSKQ